MKPKDVGEKPKINYLWKGGKKMKKCRICKQNKSIQEYYFRKDRNKLRNECKKCFNYKRNDRRRNRDRRTYYHSKHYKPINRKKQNKYILKHPDKIEARLMATQQIKYKNQKCKVCGNPAEKHHNDYTKPLKVRWLCRKHHLEVHYPTNRRER